MKPLVIRLRSGVVLWIERGHAWHADPFDPEPSRSAWKELTDVDPAFLGGRLMPGKSNLSRIRPAGGGAMSYLDSLLYFAAVVVAVAAAIGVTRANRRIEEELDRAMFETARLERELTRARWLKTIEDESKRGDE